MVIRRALWRDLPVRIKGLVVIAIPVLPLILTAWAYFVGERHHADAEQMVQHTWEVKLELERIRSTLLNAETSIRGYLVAGTNDAWVSTHNAAATQLALQQARLKTLVGDNEEQRQAAQMLESLIERRLQILRKTIAAAPQESTDDPAAVATLVVEGQRATDAITGLMSQMSVREDALLAERQGAANTLRSRLNLLLAVGAGIGVIAGVMCAWLFMTSVGHRLADTRAAAIALGEGRPVDIADAGHDEMSEMARALTRASVLLRERTREAESRMHELVAVNRELEAFSYSVSHDLRAPLRHVAGFSALLRKAPGQLTEQQQRYLTTIAEATTRMGRLIDDLLAFSRTGRAELRFQPTDVSALVQQVCEQFGANGDGPGVEWRIAPLPTVRADPAMLRVVLDNLIGNAVKYSSKREHPVIEVGTEPDDDEAVVFVRDNGVGFDMKYANKLFGVFQRLHSAEEYDGTGIGLATVRRILARHGGRAWAESELGKGATFYIALPKEGAA